MACLSLLDDLFFAQAARSPLASAIVFGDVEIKYNDLAGRCDRLKQHLWTLGVGPTSVVAIYLDRSIDMIVAVLAVLRAGAAYIPLDPAYPRSRLQFMLSDSGAKVVLTQETLNKKLGKTEDLKIVCLQEDSLNMRSRGELVAVESRCVSDLAYVIYTSGSTGKPKGIAMPHSALSNLLQVHQGLFPASARTLQFASLSFDVSFQEIFSTLQSGGTLVLIEEEVRRDPARLWDAIVNGRIERLFLPFIALQEMAEVCKGPCSLRDVVTAGEQLKITPEIRRMFRELKDCRLHNQYGPSETHVVTHFALDRDPERWPTLPPIGRAIEGTTIHVLDEGLRASECGELCVEGRSLCQGYLHRPDETAKKFIRLASGSLVYRTGDLVSRRPDGNLQFLGRIDDQIKIRGFRVELGEIEAVLCEHESVAAAAVAVHEGMEGDKRLVGYVVVRENCLFNELEVRQRIAAKLPNYMLPVAVIAINSLPLTPSGKVDRKALPRPVIKPTSTNTARSQCERIICDFYCEALEMQEVDIESDFFDLGGQSLLATRLVSRLRSRLNMEVPIRMIFEYSRIVDLAAQIDRMEADGKGSRNRARA